MPYNYLQIIITPENADNNSPSEDENSVTERARQIAQ